MGGSPSVPAAPDPVATANAQGAVNRETAISNAQLSHVNQVSPYGSQTWSLNTDTPGGKAWADYQTAYADWQNRKAAYDAAGGGSQSATTANALTSDPRSDPRHSQHDEWVAAGSPGGATTTSAAGLVANPGAAPTMPGAGIDPSWTLTTKLSDAQQGLLNSQERIGQSALNIGEAQLGRVANALSSPLSADGLPDRIMGVSAPNYQPSVNPTTGKIAYDFGATSTGLKSSVDPTTGQIKYDTGYGGLSDLMGQAGGIQRSLDLSGLSNLPGINDFSADRQKVEDALYGRSTSRLDPQWQEQQNALAVRLANQGLSVGSEAWQREMDAFGRAKNDAYSTARNDAILAGGTEQSRLFANALAGRQQGWTELLGAGNFANSAQNQAFGQLTTDRNRYTSELDRILAANNSAQAQEYGQNLSSAQFQNAAQAQEYAQMADRARLNNEAQAQEYGQNLSNGEFWNNTQTTAQQAELNRANFANTNRDAVLNERSQLRSAPLQELSGLLGMGQVSVPQFGQVQTPQMAAPDLMGATYNSYNGQLNAANAAAANSSSMFNGLMGLGGALGAAAIMSDRRVKKNVQRVGTGFNGLPLYTYQYIWGGPTQIGVMAQDVERVNPAAVVEVNGIKAVDYGRAFAGA